MKPFCGPKLSLCGLILSVWGVIQLAFMGIFYFVNSLALAEDLPGLPTHEITNATQLEEFYTSVNRGYTQNAYNCWIAACLYLVTLAISGHQFWANSRSSLSV